MKTIKLLLVSSLLFLFLSGYQAKACNQGYAQTTITLSILGCDYDVTICYKCGVSYPGDIILSSYVKKPTPPCSHPPGTTPQAIFDEIIKQLSDGPSIFILCPSPIPPCSVNPSLYFTYTVTVPVCWQKYNDNGNMVFQVCSTSTAECQQTVRVCRSPDGKINKTFGPWTPIGQPNCPDLEVDVDDPTNSGDTSGCFHFVNVCYNP